MHVMWSLTACMFVSRWLVVSRLAYAGARLQHCSVCIPQAAANKANVNFNS